MKYLILLFCLFAFPAFSAPIGNPIVTKQSTATESSHIFKAVAGYLNGFSATSGATSGYVLIYDSATVPSNGAVTPIFCYALPATSTIGASWINNPTPFYNGIVIAFSTTGCFTQTLSATAFFSTQIQ